MILKLTKCELQSLQMAYQRMENEFRNRLMLKSLQGENVKLEEKKFTKEFKILQKKIRN